MLIRQQQGMGRKTLVFPTFRSAAQHAKMALAGHHTGRGLASAVLPRTHAPKIGRQPTAPKRTQLLRCKATIQLPPDLEAELDELEKAQYCGSEGECCSVPFRDMWAGVSLFDIDDPPIGSQAMSWYGKPLRMCPRMARNTTYTHLAVK